SRPYSGEAWLVEMSQVLPALSSGLAASPPVLGAIRQTARPGQVLAFALERENRQLAFTASGRPPARELAQRTQAVFQTIGPRIAGAPDDVSFDVDLVCSTSRLREWLETHPDVREMTFWVRHSNPGLDLTDTRKLLRRIKARMEQRTITSFPD